jgi:adenylate cyclase
LPAQNRAHKRNQQVRSKQIEQKKLMKNSNKEIERKFLVVSDDYKKLASGILLQQGFLSTVKERVVRVRTAGTKALLTIKGISKGAVRTEFEYEIPPEDAKVLLDEICEKPVIKKYRYTIPWGSLKWEVDEFLGENEGLIIAEIELEEENQTFEIPDWVGKEVTDDPKYYNSNLVKFPFSRWK